MLMNNLHCTRQPYPQPRNSPPPNVNKVKRRMCKNHLQLLTQKLPVQYGTTRVVLSLFIQKIFTEHMLWSSTRPGSTLKYVFSLRMTWHFSLPILFASISLELSCPKNNQSLTLNALVQRETFNSQLFICFQNKRVTESLFQDFMIYKKPKDYLDRVCKNFQAGSLNTFPLKKLLR